MTKLSDTQAVILSAASQRDEGAVLPLPETLKIGGGAVGKVLGSLKAKGLIEHRGSRRGDNPPPLRITRAGLGAIGIEPEDAGDIQRGATEGARLADAADVEGRARSGAPADTPPDAAATRTPRAGTKQALMIELLKRPEGATVEQIAAATGWQHHTHRPWSCQRVAGYAPSLQPHLHPPFQEVVPEGVSGRCGCLCPRAIR